MQDIQGMLIRIEATTAQLRRELQRAESATGSTARKIDKDLAQIDASFARADAASQRMASGISGAMSSVMTSTTIAAAGLTALVAKSAQAAGEIETLAKIAGTSVQDFQRLSFGARTAGVDAEQLSSIFKDVGDKIGDFLETGGGEMADFFANVAPKIGATAEQFRNLSGAQGLQLYYDSLQKANLSGAQMTFYMESIADDATRLIPLLKDGGAGFAEYARQAERLGSVLSELELSQLKQLSDDARAAESALSAFVSRIATGVQPAISSMLGSLDGTGFADTARDIGDGLSSIIDNFDTLSATVGALGAGWLAIRFVDGVTAITTYVAAIRSAVAHEAALTAAQIESAAAAMREAQAELASAEAHYANSLATDKQAAAISRLRLARLGVVEATIAQEAAERAAAATSTATGTILSRALGLLGGPVGLSAILLGAGTAWLTFRDSADQARQSVVNALEPIEELRKKINDLSLAKANAKLVETQTEQKALEDQIYATTREIEGQVTAFEAYTNNFSASQKDRAAAVKEWKKEIESGADVGQATQKLVELAGAGDAARAAIAPLAAALETQKTTAARAAEQTKLLTDRISQKATTTTTATATTVASSAASRDYIKSEEKALSLSKAKTEAEKAEIEIRQLGIDTKGADAEKIRQIAREKDALAAKTDAEKEASKQAEKATKDHTKELDRQESQLEKNAIATRQRIEDLQQEAALTLAQAAATARGTDALEAFEVAQHFVSAASGQSAEELAKHSAEMLAAARASEEAKRALDDVALAQDVLERQMTPAEKSLETYKKERLALNKAMELAPEQHSRYAQAIANLDAEYAKNISSTSKWAEITQRGVDSVDQAFADMWKGVGSGFDSFSDSMLNGFKTLLAEMAHEAITRPIILSISSSLGFGTASSGGSSSQAGSLLDLNTAYNAISGLYTSATSGTLGSVASGYQAGGISGAIGGLSSSLTPAQGGAGVMLDAGGNLVDYGAGGVAGSGLSAGAVGMSAVGGAIGGYQQAGTKGAVTGGAGAAAGAIIGNVLLPGIGGMIGSALGSYIGGAMWSGDWQETAKGIALKAAEGSLMARGYTQSEKAGGLLGSDKSKTEFSKLPSATAAALQKEFDSVVESVPKIFETFGYEVADGALSGLEVSQKLIRTDSKKAQEKYAGRVAEWMTGVGNAAASEIGGDIVDGIASKVTDAAKNAIKSSGYGITDAQAEEILASSGKMSVALKSLGIKSKEAVEEIEKTALDAANAALQAATGLTDELTTLSSKKLTKALQEITGLGEKSYQTLSTLAQQLDLVNSTFRSLGYAFYESSLVGAKQAEALIAAAGGTEAFASATASYFDAFYSDTEKATAQIDAARVALSELGIAMPATAEGFRYLIESIDTTTESGRELWSQLVQLSSTASSAYAAIGTLETALQGTIDAAKMAGSALVDEAKAAVKAAYEREASALQATVDRIATLSESLSEFRDSVANTALAMQAPAKQAKALRAEFLDVAKAARDGDQAAAAKLPALGGQYLQAAESSARTRTEYMRELARVQRVTSGVESALGKQESDAQRQLTAAETSASAVVTIKDDVKTLDQTLKDLAQAQIDSDKAISESEKSVLRTRLTALGESIKKSVELGDYNSIASSLAQSLSAVDTSKDGLMSREELATALAGHATPADIEAIFKKLDANGDGTLSVRETADSTLLKKLTAIRTAIGGFSPTAVATALSAELDKKPQGLTLDDVKNALSGLATNDEIDKIFKDLDVNVDGVVSTEEAPGSTLLTRLQGIKTAVTGFSPTAVASALSSELDKKPSGLTLDDVKIALNGLATNDEIDKIFKDLDVNVDGVVSTSEASGSTLLRQLTGINTAVSGIDTSALKKSIDDAFTAIDTDRSGLLTRAELADTLKPAFTDAEVDGIISALDADGDGLVSKLELGFSDTVTAVDAVTSAVRSQAQIIASGIASDIWQAGRTVSRSEFANLVYSQPGALGSITDAQITELFNKLNQGNDNKSATLTTSGATPELTASVLASEIEKILTPAAPTPTPTATATAQAYDKSKVRDDYEPLIDAALATSGFTMSGYLSKNPDIASAFNNKPNAEKTGFGNSAEIYGAWHYSKWGAGEKRRFAVGGVFDSGIVSSPTSFDMGLMGEAGPEAIMPLDNVGGKLGVRARLDVPRFNFSDNSAPVVSAINALSKQVETLEKITRSVAVSSEKTARRVDYLERWEKIGMPTVRA